MKKNRNLKTEVDSSFCVGKWERLAELVQAFNPDIVVLVARKMPRLRELLHLEFSRTAIVITDLAIPFCHHLLRGKRVAIVDDIINYGSTMVHAQAQVRACGAESSKLFALAAKSNSNRPALDNMSLANVNPMAETDYEDFVWQVPAALQLISKPYDLDFPILRCELRPPYCEPHTIWFWFQNRFGDRAHLLTTNREEEQLLARMSLDFPAATGANLKARFYFDFEEKICNVVPMAIPREFGVHASYESDCWAAYTNEVLLDLLSDLPNGICLWPNESAARVELFSHSIAFARTVLEEVSDILSLNTVVPFSLDDAALVFGPEFSRCIAEKAYDAMMGFGELRPELLQGKESTSEAGPLRSNLEPEEKKKLEKNGLESLERGDITSAFHALFDDLANAVGATDAKNYSLSRPISRDEVAAEPYLRLRIGFSFRDLVSFFESRILEFTDSSVSVRALVSMLVDQYIDSGALVPAIANYNGSYFRVYRKGENKFWDEETRRALYAWQCIGPLSLTRFAKLQAILSFSSEVTTSLVPDAFERGTVGFLPPSVVDRSGTEFGRFLLRTGKLRVVKDEG